MTAFHTLDVPHAAVGTTYAAVRTKHVVFRSPDSAP